MSKPSNTLKGKQKYEQNTLLGNSCDTSSQQKTFSSEVLIVLQMHAHIKQQEEMKNPKIILTKTSKYKSSVSQNLPKSHGNFCSA